MRTMRALAGAGLGGLLVLAVGAGAPEGPPAEAGQESVEILLRPRGKPPADMEPAVQALPPVDIVLRAKGKGYPPRQMTGAQARLMAERAATVVALRNLAVKLGRTPPAPAEQGVIELEAFLAGYRLAERRYNDDGSVEATVEVTLHKLYGNVVLVLQEERDKARKAQAAAEEELARKRQELANSEAQSKAEAARFQAEKAALLDAQTKRIDQLTATIAARDKEIAELKAELERLRKQP